MKKMRCTSYLFLGIIILFLHACSDNEKDLSNESLYQTQWRGTLQFKDDGVEHECDITISFETATRGRYISSDLDENFGYSKQTTIEYEISAKFILLYGGVHNVLLGDWVVQDFSKKRLYLKREPNTPYESTLILTKLY